MSDFPRMVYKAGGPHEIHGGKFDYLIVHDESEQIKALADGWAFTTQDALELADAPILKSGADDNAAPTRVELEAKATELGIEFSPRIGDAKLAERIDAALAKA